MDALALTNLSIRARKKHRYGKIASRFRVLREIGRIAAEHGDIAARQIGGTGQQQDETSRMASGQRGPTPTPTRAA
jgi:hypothetical protein